MKKFEEIYTKSLKEMKLRKGFVSSSEFYISNIEECEIVCESILEDFIQLIKLFEQKLFNLAFQQEVLLESNDQLDKYNSASIKLQKIIDNIELKLSKLELYISQEKTPNKLFSLSQLFDELSEQIKIADDILPTYDKLKFVPSLDLWYNQINDLIKKYNKIIDIFNERNIWVIQNKQEFNNFDLPVLGKLKNLKNWRMK